MEAKTQLRDDSLAQEMAVFCQRRTQENSSHKQLSEIVTATLSVVIAILSVPTALAGWDR